MSEIKIPPMAYVVPNKILKQLIEPVKTTFELGDFYQSEFVATIMEQSDSFTEFICNKIGDHAKHWEQCKNPGYKDYITTAVVRYPFKGRLYIITKRDHSGTYVFFTD